MRFGTHKLCNTHQDLPSYVNANKTKKYTIKCIRTSYLLIRYRCFHNNNYGS